MTCACMTYLPLMTHWQLYVCWDTSWWTGHALALEHSYNNPPCTKTDEAQQFFTVWGCGGVAGIGESCWVSSSVEASCCQLKMFSSWWVSSSKLLMWLLSCSCWSSTEILWTSDSQLSAHWLLASHSYMQGREEGESLLIYSMNWCKYQSRCIDWWVIFPRAGFLYTIHMFYGICGHHMHGKMC